jgi:hypothetical protein
MMANLRLSSIIHARAFERAIGKSKAAWLDNVALHAKAGRGAQNSANISGNIRLVKCDAVQNQFPIWFTQVNSLACAIMATPAAYLPEPRNANAANKHLKTIANLRQLTSSRERVPWWYSAKIEGARPWKLM